MVRIFRGLVASGSLALESFISNYAKSIFMSMLTQVQSTQVKLLGAVAGIFLTGGMIWYYLRKGEASEDLSGEPLHISQISRDDVLDILSNIQKSQESMNQLMKKIGNEIIAENLDFVAVYKRVQENHPVDPLGKFNLTMKEFDSIILEKYVSDPLVREQITTILGNPSTSSNSEEKQPMDFEKLINVHKFMLEELQKLVKEFQNMEDSHIYDKKIVTIAIQGLIGAHVQKSLDATAEMIECSVIHHHADLVNDSEFIRINVRMQELMQQCALTNKEN